MEAALSLEQFKELSLRYQNNKKIAKQKVKRKVDYDLYAYSIERTFHIRKRCGYYK